MKIYACKNKGVCIGSIVTPYTLHIGQHETPESAKEACNEFLGCGIVELNIGLPLRCKLCKETIISLHRHDFVTCECGALSIDGGGEYTKLSFKRIEDVDFLDGY